MTVKFATTRYMAQGLNAPALQDRRAHMAVIDIAMRWNARCTFTCVQMTYLTGLRMRISNLHAWA